MDVRIVLLPDFEGDETLKEYSGKIAKIYPPLFQIGKDCVPHITLMHLQARDENLIQIKEILKAFARETAFISVDFDYEKREAETNNYISIFFKNDIEITDLRDSLNEELKEYVLSTSKFKPPHVTLTRLINTKDVDKALVQVSTFSNARVHLTKLALCEVGENGTCKNIIFSYDLKDSTGSV